MNSFSKKIETQSQGNSASAEQWNAYNEHVWEALDVEPFEGKNGKLIKESTEIGVLNFIMEIGSQPNNFAKMTSKVAAPTGDEVNSPEELEVLKTRPNNEFFWDTDFGADKKPVTVRKVRWPIDPEEELVLAIDFPSVKIDYSLHPATEGESGIKPLRVDYNGKGKGEYRNQFQRKVSNEVNWRTGEFGANDIKYKITQAIGSLEKYKSDGHDLAYLVQATCNWTVRMTKDVKTNDNGDVIATYYDVSIKNPEKIQDIKTRRDTYTVEEQLKDAECEVPFCGILMNGGEYPEENLQQVRGFWWEKVKQAVTFDKNEGKEGKDSWIKGLGWEGSDLQRAYDASTVSDTQPQASTNDSKEESDSPKQQVREEVKPSEGFDEDTTYNEPPMDFDDD